MDVYHGASKRKLDSLHGLSMRSMVKPQSHLEKGVKGYILFLGSVLGWKRKIY